MHLQANDEQWQLLDKKVEFLSQPEAYEETCSHIEAIETHMSWVFLTEKHAYKLKKPVLSDYLDLVSVQSRYENCQKELKINQPLGAGIYRDVVPLKQKGAGQFIVIGSNEEGNIVDWLVKMRRFPREKTLEEAIKKDRIDESLLQEASQKLAKFYRQANPVTIEVDEYESRYKSYLDDNKAVLSRPEYGLSQDIVQNVHAKQYDMFQELSDLFRQRVREGRIIECHGDLRPEHICLVSPPIIIDRLDFSRKLRIMDPVEELSYLSLECEFLGKSGIGEYFINDYQEMLDDRPPPALFDFYKSYRACLRAKISACHLDDHRVADRDKWRAKAKEYLNFAASIL